MSDNEGEEIVNTLLKQNFKKNFNYLSANITLPVNDADTTRIAHILINEYGIFVIETIHYSGWIFGSETDSQWTQTYDSGLKLQFLNPIIQNKNHIQYLRQYLPAIPEKAFKSIIVFTGTAELRTAAISNVIKTKALVDYIKQFRESVLSRAEIETIVGKIEFNRKDQSEETDVELIEDRQNKFNQQDDSNKKAAEEIEFLPRKTITLEKTNIIKEQQEEINKEYAEYKEKLNKSDFVNPNQEPPLRTDFITAIMVILITAGILGFIVFLTWDQLFPAPQPDPNLTLIKPKPARIKNTDPSAAARQQMNQIFKQNAEKNQQQKQKRQTAVQQARQEELERLYAEIAERQTAENLKDEFNKQYKPRAECNDPMLEWSKTVLCVNERISAREKFYKIYKKPTIDNTPNLSTAK